MSQINFDLHNLAYEWLIYQDKHFSVMIRAWRSYKEWKWNVYAHIFEDHPIYGKVDAMKCLPFHGGVTYDKKVTYEPTGEIRTYNRPYSMYKIGSDYAHYMDYYENEDPKNGIPPLIRHDAEQLATALFEMTLEVEND